MPRNFQEPVVSKTDNMGDMYEHPAYAVVGASRVSGQSRLFNSDFNHHHYISLKIQPAKLYRSLSRDWVHSSHIPYIEINMSETQWAQMISSLNMGDGVPCTLTDLNGVPVPQIPEPKKTRMDDHIKELGETFEEAKQYISRLETKINEMKISVKQRDDLLSTLRMIQINISSNAKFVAKQFGEAMENIVDSAKIEVNAYVNNTITRAGIEAIANNNILSLEGK